MSCLSGTEIEHQICACMHACMHAYIRTYTHLCTYTKRERERERYEYVCITVCSYVYVYIHTHIMCICICIYMVPQNKKNKTDKTKNKCWWLINTRKERYTYMYLHVYIYICIHVHGRPRPPPKIYIHGWLITLALLHTMIIRIPICRKCCGYQSTVYASHEVWLLITCLSFPNQLFVVSRRRSSLLSVWSTSLDCCLQCSFPEGRKLLISSQRFRCTVPNNLKTISQRPSRLCGFVCLGFVRTVQQKCKV